MADNQTRRLALAGLKKFFDNKTGLLSKTNLDERFVQSKPIQFAQQGFRNIGLANQQRGDASQYNMFSQLSKPEVWNQTTQDLNTLRDRSQSNLGRTGLSFLSSLTKNQATGTGLIRSGIEQKDPKQLITGAYKVSAPSIALAGGPGKALFATGLGGVLGYGGAKLFGGDPAQGAGEGAFTGLKTRAVTQFTDPVIDKVLGSLAPQATLLTRQLFKRTAGGSFNIIEDEIISKLEGEATGLGQRVTSFIIGAVISGNDELFDIAKKNLEAKGFEIPKINKLIDKTKSFVNDESKKLGQWELTFTKPDGTKYNQIMNGKDFADWTRQLDQRGIKYDYKNLGTQGGFAQLGGKNPRQQLEEIIAGTGGGKQTGKIKTNQVMDDVAKQKYFDAMMEDGQVILSKNFNETKFRKAFDSAWEQSKNIDQFKKNFAAKIKVGNLNTSRVLADRLFKRATQMDDFKAKYELTPPKIEEPKLVEAKIVKPSDFDNYLSVGDNKNAIKALEQSLPSKTTVESKNVAESYKKGVDGYKSVVNKILDKIEGKFTKEQFFDLVESQRKTGDPIVDEALSDYKLLTDSLYNIMEDTSVGKIQEGYAPRSKETSITDKDIDELFPDAFISRSNIEGGNLKRRTGSLKEYSKNIKKRTDDLIEQAMYHKYRDISAPISENKQVILDELNEIKNQLKIIKYENPDNAKDLIKNLRNRKPLNYVDLVANESSLPKTKIEEPVYLRVGKNTIRTDANVFERFKNDELQSAFQLIKDGHELFEHRQLKTQEIIDGKNPESVINYWVKELEMSGVKADQFLTNAKKIVNRIGPEEFNRSMLYQATRNYPMENFINTLSKFDFTEFSAKEYVNDFIHRTMIKNKMLDTQMDKLFDGISRVFSAAQIGGNIKTALVQPLEATKVPFLYGTNNSITGFKKSITDSDRLLREYGIGDEKSVLNIKNVKTTDGASKGKLDFLYKGLEATENWKNRIFAAAIEAKGLNDGMELGSKELRDFVRRELPKYALPSGKFDSPVLLKESSAARLGLQYSNFAIKGATAKLDTIQDKEFNKLAGLLTSDAINIAIITAVTGTPLKWAIQGLFPAGLGPIFSFTGQVYEEVKSLIEANKEGEDISKPLVKLWDLALGNLIPGGSQIKKTSKTGATLVRGYDTTPSGRVKYLAPDTSNFIGAVSAALGLVFGESALFENRKYYGEKRFSLGTKQSETLMNKNRSDRKDYYNQIMQTRDLKNDKKEKVGLFGKKTETNLDIDNLESGDYDLLKERISAGDQTLTSGELKAYYLRNADLKDTSGYGSIKSKKEVFKQLSYIDNNENLSQEQKDQLYEDLAKTVGESTDNLYYYKVANEDNDVKTAYVLDAIQKVASRSKDRGEMMRYLVGARKEVNGEILLANGVIDELYDMGLITAAEKKQLKNFKYTDDGKTGLKVKTSGRGGSAKLKSISFKAPKISTTKTTGVKLSKLSSIKTPQAKTSGLRIAPQAQTINSEAYTSAPAEAIAKIRQGNKINL